MGGRCNQPPTIFFFFMNRLAIVPRPMNEPLRGLFHVFVGHFVVNWTSVGVRVAKIMQMTDLWRGGSMNRRRPCRGSCWPDAAIRLHLPVPQTSDGPSIRPLGRCRSAVHSFHFELLAEETLQCLPAAAAFFHRFNSSFNWLPASRAHFCIDEISRRTSWGPAEPSLECAAPIFQIPWKKRNEKIAVRRRRRPFTTSLPFLVKKKQNQTK